MNNNPFVVIGQILSNGMSPEQLVNTLVQKNPQLANQVQTIKNQSNGKSYEQIAMELCQQRGIDYNQAISMLKGFKR